MGSNLIRYLCVSMLLASAFDINTADPSTQVIQMTARKYEFSP